MTFLDDPTTGIEARTVGHERQVRSALLEIRYRLQGWATPREYGALGDGATNDAAAIQRAIDSGNDVDFAGLSYVTASTLLINQSGQRIIGRGATITASGAGTSVFAVGQAADGSFVETNDVEIEGFRFVGAADGTSPSPPAAIVVRAPTTDPYVEGGGCSNIRIRDVEETGFCYGVAATAADRMVVENSRFGGNVYYPALVAGGYGVLLQTCFKVRIINNTFTGGTRDRHAIYVAANPSRPKDNDNVCKEVVVAGNTIDWRGVIDGIQNGAAPTGFEAAMVVRAPEHFALVGNTIRGGYSGVEFQGENGNGLNAVVVGNVLSGYSGSGSQRSGISFARASGAYIWTGIVISGNEIDLPLPAGASNTYGIKMASVDRVTISGNTIRNNGIAALAFAGEATNVTLGPNTLDATWGFYFDGTGNDGFTVARQRHSLDATHLYRFFTNPDNLDHDYVRAARIVSDGAGNITINYDPHGLISTVVSDVVGVLVTFTAAVAGPVAENALGYPRTAGLVNVFNHSSPVAGQLKIGVEGLSGGAAVYLPAATNAYALTVVVPG